MKNPVGQYQKRSLLLTGAVAYESFSLQSFKSQFKHGHLREWLQGELRLYPVGKQTCIKRGGMFLSSLSLQGFEMKFH